MSAAGALAGKADNRPPCPNRKHKWQTEPAIAGTPCSRCPAVFGVRGSEAGAPMRPGFGAALASVRGLPLPGAPPPPAVVAPPAPPPPPEPPTAFHRRCAKGLTGWAFAFGDMGANAALKRFGKEVEETDANDQERREIETEMAEQMAIWFPKTNIQPWGRAAILFASLMGEKVITARDIKERPALPSSDPRARILDELKARENARSNATQPATVAAPTSRPADAANPSHAEGGSVDA